MTDPNVVSVSLLAMTQSIGVFTTFLPPLPEVRRRTFDDRSFVADVRVGEVAAAGLTIGIGAMISSLTKSPVPTVVSVASAVGMIVLYEMTLRSSLSEEITP